MLDAGVTVMWQVTHCGSYHECVTLHMHLSMTSMMWRHRIRATYIHIYMCV